MRILLHRVFCLIKGFFYFLEEKDSLVNSKKVTGIYYYSGIKIVVFRRILSKVTLFSLGRG